MDLKIIRQCRFVDALAAWGGHEGQGRLRENFPARIFVGEDAKINSVEVALANRMPMVRLIWNSQPVACLQIELVERNLSDMLVFDGRAASVYADELLNQESESGEYVRRLANADNDVAGPLICIARVQNQQIQPPLTTFDGCHRLAAWVGQLKRKQPYPISAYAILTLQQIEFWRSTPPPT